MARNARFSIVAPLDRGAGAQRGTVTIDRDTGVVVIRGHKRRKFWLTTLGEMVQREVWRLVKAEVRERKLAKKARRGGGR